MIRYIRENLSKEIVDQVESQMCLNDLNKKEQLYQLEVIKNKTKKVLSDFFELNELIQESELN